MMQNNEPGVRSRKSGENGFTLIETVITLVVLSIAAIGVLSVFTVGIKGSANPLVAEQAVQLAQEKMDMIIGDRENPAVGFGFSHIVPGSYPAESAGSFGFAGFSRTTTIICVDATTLNTNNGQAPPCTISGYTHVAVTVANTLISSVSVETIVTNY
jgi:prepilin-type N-terminal cleavage/methylation domain-containing protein